ncbi:hypothetical protein D0T12_27765 [Actinomadura spongiicola]|uniref:Uncharacterized protein n=1 Tax=Actinomadura spongiicola TaxID=2303421 RepID=A0A372GA82_9ACTN|nr:hypothetical protein [Actinomadura spongiicola]RFS82052.1 hypothetical protein D0T12_27765 [Actinomadura spongiicola]
MELDWGYFRGVYEDLLDHQNDVAARQEYLIGQQRTASAHLAELAPLRTRERIPPGGYSGDDEQLWRIMKLYALSRVSDQLIESFCPEGVPPRGFGVTGGRAVIEGSVTHRIRGGAGAEGAPGWIGPRRLDPAGRDVYTRFLTGIGLTPFEHAEAFSPFHHEIFAVVQDPAATSVILEEVLWPGFWFGDLLFSRAGVRVRAPRHLVDASVATSSTLYFTFCRVPRPTNDMSHGWGSNSQWRTSFPRFYSDADGLHLNWDGEVDIGADPPVRPADMLDDPAPLDERRELLLHRCFVRSALPEDEDDRYPFDDRLSLTTAEWPLRPESIVHVPWAK